MSKTTEFIDNLFKQSSSPCLELKGKCQKCKTEVVLVIFQKDKENIEGNGGIIISDQFNAKPEFKCLKCLEEDNNMISPTKTEVFSRVCGYLRPIQSYNLGKKEEFRMRKNFDIKKEIKK